MKKLFIISLMAFTIPCFAAYLNNAFNSGELSPLLRYRVDLDKKYLGVETMENFLVKPQGAAVRRPGTYYVATGRGAPCEYPTLRYDIVPEDTFSAPQTLAIANVNDLQDMNNDLTGNYYLTGDIDATATSGWNGGEGFIPIGFPSGQFTGTFDGNGYTISNLFINRPSSNGQALFADTYGGDTDSVVVFKNVTLTNVNITGEWLVAALLGVGQWNTAVINCHSSGTINGTSDTGGLIGLLEAFQKPSWAYNSSSSCTVVGRDDGGEDPYSIGGFIGEAYGTNIESQYPLAVVTIQNCFATGNVTSADDRSTNMGGFAGQVLGTNGIVYGCYATGGVTAAAQSGGFFGMSPSAITGDTPFLIKECYSTGTVTGIGGAVYDDTLGGFGGYLLGNYTVQNCYTWSPVVGTDATVRVAGFIAGNYNTTATKPTSIINCYSAASLSGGTSEDGFISLVDDDTTITSCYWDTDVSGTESSGGGIGKTTTQMQTQSTFEDTGWDFDTIWEMTCESNEVARLIPFESATDDAYVIEAGNQYLRFYRTVVGTAGQIVDGAGDPYEINTVYDSDQVSEIQYVQSNDVMYIVHPDDPPQKLIRIDHDDWTIADVDWEWGPFLDQNTTTTTITPSAATGTITLTASSAIFTADNVGSLWKIIEKSDNSAIDGTLDANGSSATVAIEGDGLLTLESTWTGLVTLEKSVVGAGSWEPVYPKLNGDAANIEYSFSESDAGYEYRVTMSSFSTGKCEYTLVAYNSDVAGYVEVTAFTSTTVVTATVTSTLAGTDATTKWAEGAWSTRRGYPRSICIYQNRLCLAGTTYQPNGFWTSTSFDLENMRESTLDNGAINEEISATKQNPILWLQDKNGVIAGTSGSVIRIFSQSNTSVLTPASFGAERQAEAGSADMQPALIGESIVFVDRNRRKVRDIIYDLQSDGFVSPELTVMAEHITSPGLIDIAVQNRPDDIVWFIRSDGQLISLTYNRNEGVVAWARHITDGEFESVCVIPGADEDEIWVVVSRTIEGTDVRYIEQMQPQDWGTDSNNCWFVDSGLSYSGVATSTITGLDHLEGETLQAFYNGTEFENVTVSGGNVTLSESVTAATIGLPYTSTFLTFPIEMQTQRGFSVGYKKKVYEIAGCFYRTMNGQYGLKEQFTEPTMYDIMFDEWPDTTNGSEDPYTGQIRLEVDGGWSDEVQIKFLQEEPYPFNITAVQTKIEISEN